MHVTMRKIASWILLLAVAAGVAGAIRWRGAGSGTAALAGERASLQAELDTTRARLHKESLRYRGFLKGMDAIPDSIRTAQAGETMKQTNLYRKAIENLEGEERHLVAAMRKIDRRIAAAEESRRHSVRPFAVAAAVLLAAGAALHATARLRRVAP
jgi:hypothetical protein